MKTPIHLLCAGSICALAGITTNAQERVHVPPALVQPRQPDGQGAVAISGELKQWHKVTLTLDGPFAAELDQDPNPFTDYNLMVTFTHESGAPTYQVPGYFAADGNAGETSATTGTKWRAHPPVVAIATKETAEMREMQRKSRPSTSNPSPVAHPWRG